MACARGPYDLLMSAMSVLTGLGFALPRHSSSTPQMVRFLREVAAAQPGASARFVDQAGRLAAQSGIDTRYSVLSDYAASAPSEFSFFPKTWSLDPFPGTAARMAVYKQAAPSLAAIAARRALEDAGVEPEAVTHLLFTTCTGFFAPGPELALVRALGLLPSTRRIQVGFMGCYAGAVALRLADELVRSDPRAVVLQVSVELCSLHFQKAPRLGLYLANALFGDGAAAAVYQSRQRSRPEACYAEVRATRSCVADETDTLMSWDVGDHGFEMTLSPEVPAALGEAAPAFVAALLGEARLAECAPASLDWAIHPGGLRIVQATAEALGLGPEAQAPALSVLREVGNLSSATLLFVLAALLGSAPRAPAFGTLAFGPGLTIEGAILERGPRAYARAPARVLSRPRALDEVQP
jgi:alpha-pyrone synthase